MISNKSFTLWVLVFTFAAAGIYAAESEPTNARLSLSGRIVDSGGKAIAGGKAKLVGPDRLVVSEAVANAHGEFHIAAEKSAFKHSKYRTIDSPAWKHAHLVGSHEKHGPVWTAIHEITDQNNIELKLVRDIPIQGRILDSEGRPVEGVQIVASRLRVGADDSLDGFFKANRDQTESLFIYTSHQMRALPVDVAKLNSSVSTVTNKSGQFEVRGIGQNRIVDVAITGRTIASTSFIVATVSKIDAKWRRRSNSRGVRAAMRQGAEIPTVYPSTFHHVSLPGQVISGVVTDRATGEPITDAYVFGRTGGVGTGENRGSCRTDKNGRYELLGMKTEGELTLSVYVEPSQGYISASRGPMDFSSAAKPRDTDFQLVRGIRVRGKVRDAKTKKPVAAGVMYLSVSGNEFVQQLPDRVQDDALQYERTRDDGSYEVVATPGPGFVVVVANDRNYQTAVASDFQAPTDERGRVETNEHGIVSAERFHAVHPVSASESRDAFELNFELTRSPQRKLQFVDQDGQPLKGVTPFGGTNEQLTNDYGRPIDVSEVSLHSIPAGRQRLFMYHHTKKGLGGFAIASAESPAATEVVMRRWGRIRGRVDNRSKSNAPYSDLITGVYRIPGERRYWSVARTQLDADGQFRLPKVITGLELQIVAGRFYTKDAKLLGTVRLRSGEDRDLGSLNWSQATTYLFDK